MWFEMSELILVTDGPIASYGEVLLQSTHM